MTVFVVFTIARQVEGDTIIVRGDKAFLSAAKADAFMAAGQKVWPESIMAEDRNGLKAKLDCLCERAVHTFEVEE